MRLLNCRDYTFKDFIGQSVPKYAIISHRWTDDEVTHQDFLDRKQDFTDGNCSGYGWTKIRKACEIALENKIEWVWLDTICIDKKSSAELTEAINSMFRWYKDSSECYLFLPDVNRCPTCGMVNATASQHIHRETIKCTVYAMLYDPIRVNLTELSPEFVKEFLASDWFCR